MGNSVTCPEVHKLQDSAACQHADAVLASVMVRYPEDTVAQQTHMLPVLCDCFDGFGTKKERDMCSKKQWVCSSELSNSQHPDEVKEKHPECTSWVEYVLTLSLIHI